jgi:uncharacterized protein RhaS with RHS repeats
MKGRLYDPRMGRFITPDPFVTDPFSAQGLNRYAYVQNNPLSYVDPTGFQDIYPPEMDTIHGPPPGYGYYHDQGGELFYTSDHYRSFIPLN